MRRSGILAAGLVLAAAAGAPADTIVPTGGSIYTDHEAKAVGDVLTILIVETTQASKSTATRTRSETENGLSSAGRLDFFDFWNLDVNNQSLGEGSTARRGDLQARITATIVDIDDNGLLVVEGSRSVRVNGEEEKITLRGRVRQRDILSDNTIFSTFVANATIEYSGQGVLASAERPGIISRFMNWLF